MSKLQKKGKVFAAVSILLMFRKMIKWIPELRSICHYWDDFLPILFLTWIVMILFLCNIFLKKKWFAVFTSVYFSIAAALDALLNIGSIMCLFDDYVGLDFAINLIFAIMSCTYIINTDTDNRDNEVPKTKST